MLEVLPLFHRCPANVTPVVLYLIEQMFGHASMGEHGDVLLKTVTADPKTLAKMDR